MQGVFNPNIPIYHPPNSGEGLHFSAFHFKNVFSVLIKNKNKKPKWRFFTSHGAHLNCTIMAMLYTHSIGNQL